MAKYSSRIVVNTENWVTEHGYQEYGGANAKELYEYLHISKETHYHWLDIHSEYADAIQRGKEAYRASLPKRLVMSLMAKAEGGYHEETTETETTQYYPKEKTDKNGDVIKTEPKIKSMTKTKTKSNKYHAPDTGAAIFLLTNLDPEHWQNRQRQDVNIKKADVEEKSLEELNAEIERLSKFDASDKNELQPIETYETNEKEETE